MKPFSVKESKILDNLFLHTDCKTYSDARRCIDKAYDDGMTIDDLHHYFTINSQLSC